VLVVDDDPDFRKFAVRAVKLAFFGMRLRVNAAMTGTEALAAGATAYLEKDGAVEDLLAALQQAATSGVRNSQAL
jgi:CheY-like chemotaxis protein